MSVADKQAFPQPVNDAGWLAYPGMTIRQYAAIEAMKGLLAIEGAERHYDFIADEAVCYAEALIKRLERAP